MTTLAPFDTSEVDGTPGIPRVTWQQYFSLRNDVLRACRPFGSVGPMGECLITADPDGPPEAWSAENESPLILVVDDWLNDWQTLIRIETDPGVISDKFLRALSAVLVRHQGWGIGVAVGGGYLLLLKDRMMADGPLFRGCKSPAEVISACQRRA